MVVIVLTQDFLHPILIYNEIEFKNMNETKTRTITRMITYRITAWLFTIFWTWLFIGDISKSTGFATALHILLSIDYYVHERIWLKIKWGKTHV